MRTLVGSNQYKTKTALSKSTILSIWQITAVVAIGTIIFMKTAPKITSPCPNSGCFIKIVKAEELSPANSPEEIVRRSKHPDQIYHIWGKESSYGRNKNPKALHNLCKAQGKSNEFGFGGMAHKWCYANFQEAVNVVDAWLSNKDNENLCMYNLGKKVSDCPYVK